MNHDKNHYSSINYLCMMIAFDVRQGYHERPAAAIHDLIHKL